MLIQLKNSRSITREIRNSRPRAQTLLIPAMVAALLMAAALAGCSAAPHNQQTAAAILIHTEAVGQDNGNLTGNFSVARKIARGHDALYAAAAAHPLLTRAQR